MQCIRTHYVGPSNTRGSRIIALADGGRVVMDYDPRHDSETNHAIAARALRDKLGWKFDLVSGWYKNDGYWINARSAFKATG